MSGTKWRQSMQVLKEKQNYLQKQKLTSLLRDPQRLSLSPFRTNQQLPSMLCFLQYTILISLQGTLSPHRELKLHALSHSIINNEAKTYISGQSIS